ncbi:hypothetical protein G4B88_025910 [Cannabis sativa]|uniref:Reverse transcriptase zinc-binding domain-containing protein n=1 Tax=Cannabis sativa TaxID=3483 RepID=A0A7J6HGB4_CANSA|nr:hypothetical protein G4B88_025910 [Cannabis sativa]
MGCQAIGVQRDTCKLLLHIHVDLTCPLCTKSPESTSHVLFGCEFARSCWNISSVTVAGVEENMCKR